MIRYRLVSFVLLWGTALGAGCDFVSGEAGTFSAVADGATWELRGGAFINGSGRLAVFGEEEGCGVCASITLTGGELFDGEAPYSLEDVGGFGLLSYSGGDAVGAQYIIVHGSSSLRVTSYDAARERIAGEFSMVFVESDLTRPNDSSAPPDTVRIEGGRFDVDLSRLDSGE